MPSPRIPKGGTRLTIYREVAWLRLAEAETLLKNHHYNGAIYLAGYAIECQLKFAVCRQKGCTYLPENLEVHDWDVLIAAAGLATDIQAERSISNIYEALAQQWGPALRYRTKKYPPKEATQLYKEMADLYDFLNELVP
jgi:HEPN domain-containing protein